jgi:hypothetical protein
MQENKTTTIHLRSFAEKYLQFIKNNHASPSCNTFLQEKHHRMPKISSFIKCAFLKSANNPNRALKIRPHQVVSER